MAASNVNQTTNNTVVGAAAQQSINNGYVSQGGPDEFYVPSDNIPGAVPNATAAPVFANTPVNPTPELTTLPSQPSPNDVSGPALSPATTPISPTPQAFAQQIAVAIEPNCLNNCYNPTYHFRFFAANDQDILAQSNNSIAAIASKQVNQITIAESGVTGFNIREVEITTVAAGTNTTGDQNGTQIMITIVDPLGISFLDAMRDAVDLLEIKNYTKCIYYLELTFLGYDPTTGKMVNPASGLPNNGVWIWAVYVNSINCQINEGGGVFKLTCVIPQFLSRFDPNSDMLRIPQHGLTVSGKTVREILADFVTKINAAWKQEYSSAGGPPLVVLQPIVTTPIKLGPPSAIGKDPGNFIMITDPDKNSQRSVEFTAGNGVVTCHLTAGVDISDFITATINNTEEGQALIKGEPIKTRKDQTNTQTTPQGYREIVTFSTDYDVKYVGYDPLHNQYIKQVTPRAMEHVSQEPIISPTQTDDAQKPANQQASFQSILDKGMLKKRYDYIYTGENTEVLEFNIDWDWTWQAYLPSLDGARMDIDNAETNAVFNQNQKSPQCDLNETWQKTANQTLNSTSLNTQTTPTPGTSSASQTLAVQPSGAPSWNSLVGSAPPNPAVLGPNSNPVAISTQEILQGSLNNTNDPFIAAMYKNIQSVNSSQTPSTVAAATQKLAVPATPPPQVQQSATGNNIYIEDIEDTVNQTGTSKLPLPISFWHGYFNQNVAGGGYIGPYHRDKSLLRAVTSQLQGDADKPLLTGKFQNIEMTIRGDPYWLGQTNLERQLVIRTNQDAANPKALPDWQTSKPLLLFYSRYPVQIGDNFKPILESSPLINGVFQAVNVVSTFSEGAFKQKITGPRQPIIDLDIALSAANIVVSSNTSGAGSSPTLAASGSATTSGGNTPGVSATGPSLAPTSSNGSNPTPTTIQSSDSTTVGNLSSDQLANLKAAIGQKESGNNPSQGNNGLGYIGQYQFGQSALISTGYVTPGVGQTSNPSSWQWTGQNGVNSVSDFLSNPNAQNSAMNNLMTQNYNTMAGNGTITSSTSPQTVGGLLGAAQLAGAGGASNFSKGNGNPSDAFGTSTQSYYNLGYNSVNSATTTQQASN